MSIPVPKFKMFDKVANSIGSEFIIKKIMYVSPHGFYYSADPYDEIAFSEVQLSYQKVKKYKFAFNWEGNKNTDMTLRHYTEEEFKVKFPEATKYEKVLMSEKEVEVDE